MILIIPYVIPANQLAIAECEPESRCKGGFETRPYQIPACAGRRIKLRLLNRNLRQDTGLVSRFFEEQ